MFVDSHCHLDRIDLSPFAQRFENLLDAAAEQGVNHMLCVCVDLDAYPAMRALVDPYPQISVSVGVHPDHRAQATGLHAALCREGKDARVVALGETGLDYFRANGDLDWQREQFRIHIAAARELDKPIIVHTRDAREDTLTILREEGARDAGGVLHCFTESWDMARAAMDLGFYISISGIVTFRNADALREVARKLPADRLLIETDSPWLAPVPKRGRDNQPAYVRHVAEFLAELRGVEVEQLAQQTSDNFRRLFPLAKVTGPALQRV